MIYRLCEWLAETAAATAIRESAYLFPLLEAAHVTFIALVVGSISIVDLRLLGWASHTVSVRKLSEEVLLWTWLAFICAFITGALLFISNATGYYDKVPFRWKILLMGLAGVNMLVFQFITYRSVLSWELGSAPRAARVAGGMSLALWVGVVVFGRWTGFV